MNRLFQNRVILYPTDFSDSASTAFELACSLARDQEAKLIVMHVVPPPAVYGEAVARRQDDSFWLETREQLYGIKPADPDIEVEYLLEEGDPAAVIADTAEANECDLIVMGTHGRSGLGRLFMGSVAEHVLAQPTVPS